MVVADETVKSWTLPADRICENIQHSADNSNSLSTTKCWNTLKSRSWQRIVKLHSNQQKTALYSFPSNSNASNMHLNIWQARVKKLMSNSRILYEPSRNSYWPRLKLPCSLKVAFVYHNPRQFVRSLFVSSVVFAQKMSTETSSKHTLWSFYFVVLGERCRWWCFLTFFVGSESIFFSDQKRTSS